MAFGFKNKRVTQLLSLGCVNKLLCGLFVIFSLQLRKKRDLMGLAYEANKAGLLK